MTWTPEEDHLLSELWGLVRPKEILRRLRRLNDCGRTLSAVYSRAGTLGLNSHKRDTEFSIGEVAECLGVTRALLYHLIARGKVQTVGRAKCRFITVDEFERIAALFPQASGPTLTKTEARRRLGYSESHITRLLITGAIRGTKRGDRWFVDLAHVEELEAQMRKTGATRLDWRNCPALDQARAKSRENGRRRRARSNGKESA